MVWQIHDEDDKKPLPIGKKQKSIALFKNKVRGKIMIETVGLKAKTYEYLMDEDSQHKKSKGTKKCVIKQILMFKDYKECVSIAK